MVWDLHRNRAGENYLTVGLRLGGEGEAMAKGDGASDFIATLAQESARKVGCQALRWWQDQYNPRRLYIEVNYTLANGRAFPVWISTGIPGQVEESHAA